MDNIDDVFLIIDKLMLFMSTRHMRVTLESEDRIHNGHERYRGQYHGNQCDEDGALIVHRNSDNP